MDRRIEIVDELGTYGMLGQHELNGCLGGLCVSLQDADCCVIWLRRTQLLLLDEFREPVGQSGEGLVGAVKILAHLIVGTVTREATGRIRQEELVALLDDLDTLSQLFARQFSYGIACSAARPRAISRSRLLR